MQNQKISCKVITDVSVENQYTRDLTDIISVDIESFDLKELEDSLTVEDIIIAGSNSTYWKNLFASLELNRPEIKKYVYYDNPESYIPGGYSEKAEKIFPYCKGIIYSNENHVISGVKNRYGVSISDNILEQYATGYYPKGAAEIIKAEKINKTTDRQTLVYIGGANNEYYYEAFPHLLTLLESCKTELHNTSIVLQQHPRSRKEGNIDGKLLSIFSRKNPHIDIIVSNSSTIETLKTADAVLYHQTSMAPQFIFADIEKVAQIGRDRYTDTLVEAGVPSITLKEELLSFLQSKQNNSAIKQSLDEKLGINNDWEKKLLNIVKELK